MGKGVRPKAMRKVSETHLSDRRRERRRALVAQLAEQRTLNPKVEGSIPSERTRDLFR